MDIASWISISDPTTPLAGGFITLVPTVTKYLDFSEISITWSASLYSLVTGALILPFGRLADNHGGFALYVAGIIWMCIWSLVAGFSPNALVLNSCRAMQGLGAAACLPAGLNLLGRTYRPGPRKNMVFSIYRAMAPLGFTGGVLIACLSPRFGYWSWSWFF